MQGIILFKLEYLCTILLACVAFAGDWLVKNTTVHIHKALFDNSTHCIIGGLTWYIITLKVKTRFVWHQCCEVFLCALIASIIDLDHFLAARSLKLKEATNLKERPILHCSTIPVIITLLLIFLAKYFVSETIYRVAWILFAAFASHHIRDSTRRGLCFSNYRSTPPIPYFGYITLTMIIPHFIIYFLQTFYVHNNTFVDNLYNNILDV